MKERDRRYARQLPDEFITMSGMPFDRPTLLVGQHWASKTAPARAELAHTLLQPLLEPEPRSPSRSVKPVKTLWPVG
jgi:hypothetical protein